LLRWRATSTNPSDRNKLTQIGNACGGGGGVFDKLKTIGGQRVMQRASIFTISPLCYHSQVRWITACLAMADVHDSKK
jgi:hypothetical protein